MDFSFIFPSLLFILSFLLFRAILKGWAENGRKKTHLPPSPMALPILGHIHLLRPLLHQAFHALATRYGPLFRLHFPSIGDVIVVSSPAMAKEFLKSQDPFFAARPHLVADDYLDEGVVYSFLPYGPTWKFMKKLFVAELFSTKKLERRAHIRQEEIRRFLLSLLEKSKSGKRVEVEEMLTSLTGNIIWRMMIARCEEVEKEALECQKLVRDMMELFGKLTTLHLLMGRFAKWDFFGYGRRYKDLEKRFLEIMEKIISEHEWKQKEKLKDGAGGEDEENFLDALLKLSVDEQSEFELTRNNIKSIIKEMLTAGTETSSDALNWALAELMNHPTALKKAREEIDSLVDKNRLVNESDIPNLPYIQAIAKETLRLHPVAPLIPRRCIQDCTIAGYNIATETAVFINVWTIGRDPEHWESPHEFQPERFLNNFSNIDAQGHHFQFLPFGSGRRMCPGTPLALPVMHLTLAAIVQCFDWKMFDELRGSGKVEMEEAGGRTLRMAKPLSCIPVPRCTPFA